MMKLVLNIAFVHKITTNLIFPQITQEGKIF